MFHKCNIPFIPISLQLFPSNLEGIKRWLANIAIPLIVVKEPRNVYPFSTNILLDSDSSVKLNGSTLSIADIYSDSTPKV